MPKIKKSATALEKTGITPAKASADKSKDAAKHRGANKPIEITKGDGRKLVVISRTTMSYYNADEDKFHDVFIYSINKRKGEAMVSINERTKVIRGTKEKITKFPVPLGSLDTALNPDINQRFGYFDKMAEATIEGRYPSLLVLGEGGLGKSHTLLEIIKRKGLVDGEDFIETKGYMTAKALYELFSEYPDKTLIFDDIDSIFNSKDSANLLKAALDSKKTRKITWATARGNTSTTFSGSVIFLSNKRKEDFESAILSRTILVDLFMTPEEKLNRLRHILPHIDYEGKSMPLTEKQKILGVLDKYKNTLHNLNARTLLKALKVYAESDGDLELVKYQILNS